MKYNYHINPGQYKGYVGSNGKGEPESVLFPAFLFIVCASISFFSYKVSQFEWAHWYWPLYMWLYGIAAVAFLVMAFDNYLDR